MLQVFCSNYKEWHDECAGEDLAFVENYLWKRIGRDAAAVHLRVADVAIGPPVSDPAGLGFQLVKKAIREVLDVSPDKVRKDVNFQVLWKYFTELLRCHASILGIPTTAPKLAFLAEEEQINGRKMNENSFLGCPHHVPKIGPQ